MPVLDFIGTIVLTAIIVVSVNALISTIDIPRTGRLAIAGAVGLWVGLQAALATSGVYVTGAAFIGLSILVAVLAAVTAYAASPALRRAVQKLPTPLLVGLHASRVLGVFFLLLAVEGRLSGPFPLSAGIGDIITGVLALPLAIALARGSATRTVLVGWSIFGTLDLVVAAGLGIASAEGTPLQLIHVGAGSAAIASLPWAFIPTVAVPFFLIVHAIIFVQLRESSARPTRFMQAA